MCSRVWLIPAYFESQLSPFSDIATLRSAQRREFLRKDFAMGGEIFEPGFNGVFVSPHVFVVTGSGSSCISSRAAGPWAVAARSKESGGARIQFEHNDVVVFLRFVSTAIDGAGTRWMIVGGLRLVRESLSVAWFLCIATSGRSRQLAGR